MSSPASDLHYAPSVSKRFTSFAAQLNLNAVANAANSAPATAGGRPVYVVVEVTAADTHLDYIDDGGALVAINFDAVGTYHWRFSPKTIETTTNVAAVTVFWMPRQY